MIQFVKCFIFAGYINSFCGKRTGFYFSSAMIVLGSCAMSLIELHRRNLRRRKQKSIQKRKLLSENSSSLNPEQPHQTTLIGPDGASGGSGGGGAIPPLLQQLSNMSSKDPNSSGHHSGAELVLPGELERKESFEELNDENVSTINLHESTFAI